MPYSPEKVVISLFLFVSNNLFNLCVKMINIMSQINMDFISIFGSSVDYIVNL